MDIEGETKGAFDIYHESLGIYFRFYGIKAILQEWIYKALYD